jgi:hypothetical protein
MCLCVYLLEGVYGRLFQYKLLATDIPYTVYKSDWPLLFFGFSISFSPFFCVWSQTPTFCMSAIVGLTGNPSPTSWVTWFTGQSPNYPKWRIGKIFFRNRPNSTHVHPLFDWRWQTGIRLDHNRNSAGWNVTLEPTVAKCRNPLPRKESAHALFADWQIYGPAMTNSWRN